MILQNIVRTIVEFNKNNFEKSYSIITKVQEQVETKAAEFIETQTLIPEPGKEVIKQLTENTRNGRLVLKKYADKGYQELENYLSATR